MAKKVIKKNRDLAVKNYSRYNLVPKKNSKNEFFWSSKTLFGKTNVFLYRNFLSALDYVKEIKNYIWFSAGLFFLLGVIGFLFPVFFVEYIKKMLEELIKSTQGLSGWSLIRFIIMNNLQSSFVAALFGIFFAVIPIGIVVVNGYVLGFVANKSVGAQGIFVLWKLVPHGIFEIPAIMISVALGIKLGMFLFTYHGKNQAREYWKWVLNSVRVFVFIVIPLLVIAGIIEGLLISWMG